MDVDDVKDVNRRVIEQFRTGGPISGMHRDRLLLLTTTGRRTGRPCTTPLLAEHDGDDLIVIASNVGAPRHPDWYLNLAQQPRVHVEVDGAEFDAIATTTSGDRRRRLWAMLKERYPFFAEHEAATSREIPVVALSRG